MSEVVKLESTNTTITLTLISLINLERIVQHETGRSAKQEKTRSFNYLTCSELAGRSSATHNTRWSFNDRSHELAFTGFGSSSCVRKERIKMLTYTLYEAMDVRDVGPRHSTKHSTGLDFILIVFKCILFKKTSVIANKISNLPKTLS